MSTRANGQQLEFACDCVSAHNGYGDPWSALSKKRLLMGGAKEDILCSLAHSPKTIAQLSRELGLTPPSVFAHIGELVASELLRSAEGQQKRYPTERYYEPNFPVIRRDEGATFETICEEMSEQLASLFEGKMNEFESKFDETSLAGRGWAFEDVKHYLFARVQRSARMLLEDRGVLPPRCMRQNGAEWVFWAEEGHHEEACEEQPPTV